MTIELKWAGRHARAGRQVGKQVGRQVGRQMGRQVGRQASNSGQGEVAGSVCCAGHGGPHPFPAEHKLYAGV
ncbi:uncharacterized protein HaLaN_09587 [Haematococcus lacustris]|uniref:Uncharacterized protein n=1 Tax=Haematococcus lacustris TaxID=44745 RepID=A0A699Z2G8_HAELA|nr:uncharacterized protein HaLaN_09587 [Haematococcus lacustris]